MKKIAALFISAILLIACASAPKSPIEGIGDQPWGVFVEAWQARAAQADHITSQARPVAYDDLARHTEDKIGQTVVVAGTVIQFLEGKPADDGTIHADVRLALDDGDAVYVFYQDKTRLLEGDHVTFYAMVLGRMTYMSTENKPVALPALGCLIAKIDPP